MFYKLSIYVFVYLSYKIEKKIQNVIETLTIPVIFLKVLTKDS